MPYKDLEARRACHRKSDKKYRETHKEELRIKHRGQRRIWRDCINPSRLRRKSIYGGPFFKSLEEELDYLIKEQTRDDKRIQIKFDQGIFDYKDARIA